MKLFPELINILHERVFSMKRVLRLFLIFWIGIFVLSFFTAKTEISIVQRLGYTAVLALVAPIVSLFGGKRSDDTRQAARSTGLGSNLEIHLPLDPKVLYRIKDQKIYKGLDAAPTYEIKGNKIYPYLSPTPAFRIENNKVYRGLDAAPFLEIKGDKVYQNLSSKVVYEIKGLR